MNKNDKFHNGSSPELNDEQLDTVSGGSGAGTIAGYKDDYCETCKKITPHSFQRTSALSSWDQKKTCSVCNTWSLVTKGSNVF